MNFLKSITAAALLATAISSGVIAADLKVELEAKGDGSGSFLKVSYAAVEKALKDETHLVSDNNGTLTHDLIVEASKEVFAAAKAVDGSKYADEDTFLAELRKVIVGTATVDVESSLNAGVDESGVTDKETKPVVAKLVQALSTALKLEDPAVTAIKAIGGYTDFDTYKTLHLDGSTETLESVLANPKKAVGAKIGGVSLADIVSGKGEAKLKKLQAAKEAEEAHKKLLKAHEKALGDKDAEIDTHKEAAKKHKKALDELNAEVGPLKGFMADLQGKHYTRLKAVLKGKKNARKADVLTGDLAADIPAAIGYIAGLETRVNGLVAEMVERDKLIAELKAQLKKKPGPFKPVTDEEDDSSDGEDEDVKLPAFTTATHTDVTAAATQAVNAGNHDDLEAYAKAMTAKSGKKHFVSIDGSKVFVAK